MLWLTLRKLKSGEVYQQVRAAEALGETRSVRAVPALTRALGDQDEYVRRAAAEALGKIKDCRATPAFLAAVQDKEESVATAAIKALAEIADASTADPLLQILRNVYWSIQEEIQLALDKIEPGWRRSQRARSLIKPLVLDLKKREEEVRQTAARVLYEIADETAVNALIEALTDLVAELAGLDFEELACHDKRLNGLAHPHACMGEIYSKTNDLPAWGQNIPSFERHRPKQTSL